MITFSFQNSIWYWDAVLCNNIISNYVSKTTMQLLYFLVYHANETFVNIFIVRKYLYIYRVADILIWKPQPFIHKGFLFSVYIWPMSNIHFSLKLEKKTINFPFCYIYFYYCKLYKISAVVWHFKVVLICILGKLGDVNQNCGCIGLDNLSLYTCILLYLC